MPDLLKGMLTLDELTDKVHQGEVETVIAAFPDMYGRLLGKRFSAPYFLQEVARHGTHGCDYLLACDMEMDPVPGYRFTSWESGYGDFALVPDLASLRLLAWQEKTALVLCDIQDEKEKAPVRIAPRQVLRDQLQHAESMGYTVKGATEVEFFIFSESYRSASEKNYHGLKTFGNYIEDYHIFQGTKEEELLRDLRVGLEESGVPVECSKGEWGPGQHELNLQYTEVLEAADRQVIYKQACKELAYQKELAVTFMAKWHEDHAGSSQHVHLSLWNRSEKEGGEATNAFAGDRQFSETVPIRCSETFRHFVGGLFLHVRELSLFLGPTVNSYKRYQAGSFAPTKIAWAHDNRTTAFRVVGNGPSLRIECRIPGADANPYLAFAGLLAAGLEGIRQEIEPPPLYEGDAYQDETLPEIPKSLPDAIRIAEESSFLELAFGEDVVDHYLHFARVEQAKFEGSVTDWERIRYFERG